MYPVQHLFFGTLFGVFLLILFPHITLIGFLIIVFSSVLIDVDHYLWYVYKKKDFSLKNSYNWFMENEKKYLSLPREKRGKYYGGICIFHGIEILFAVFLIGIFLSKYFLFLFVGMSFHLLLDILDGTTFSDRIDKVSLTHDFFKFKKLRYVEEL